MAKVTMADVARAAGVSKQTVSRVVNGGAETSPETLRKVQAAIARLGYRPNSIARSLTTRQTYTLGLVVPDLSNPYFAEIAQGAELAAWEQGYNTFLSNIFGKLEHEEAALRSFEDRGVDGVILCSMRLPDKKLVPLLELQRAAVLINRVMPTKLAGTIKVDDAWGGKLAVEHLLSAQRRTLGVLAGPSKWPSSRARLKGFVDALEGAGLSPQDELVVNCPSRIEGAQEVAFKLLHDHPEVDGLVCFNDVVAIGALRACHALGVRVPEDVAIVGHDDISFASLVTPSLTTLRIGQQELGRNAVQMLLERIQGRNLQLEMSIKPELIIRESTP